MATIMSLNAQWANRPADERFTSLHEMHAKLVADRAISAARVVSSRKLTAIGKSANELTVAGPTGVEYAPSHWAFGQLATLAGAPAGYLRSLPAPLAADCVNVGLHVNREVEDVGVLLRNNPNARSLLAATGPAYGRIWNVDIVRHLMNQFGDGATGRWRVPGEFGRRITVNKDNTTLYAGDRDMFVFLCDEDNRLPVATRRGGEPDTLARGFMISNSEVGSATLSIRMFAFDYVCANRIIWGATELGEVSIRHTAKAPDRWLEEALPVIQAYTNSATGGMVDRIKIAQETKVEALDKFLASRQFGPRVAQRIITAHDQDEHRPMETVWDVVTGVTAYARSIPYQAERVAVETEAGKILEMI